MGPTNEEERRITVSGLEKAKGGNVPVNSRCPCGSGKKFKKCHGRIIVPIQTPPVLVQNKKDKSNGKA